MAKKISSEVSVEVMSSYVPDFCEGQYFFKYTITIYNKGSDIIMLKSRHWEICDFLNPIRTVDGEGVIGEQPVLQPGESFQYSSGVALIQTMGLMSGFYTFQNLRTGNHFDVEVPRFQLIADFRLN